MKVAQRNPRTPKRRLAYTLVELMVCLSIFAFSSTAVSSLMFATYNTNRHVKGMADSTDAVEIVFRRIVELSRSASVVSFTDTSTGLMIETPPDSNNNNLAYWYVYKIDPLNPSHLIEQILSADGNFTQIQNQAVITNLSTNSGFRVTELSNVGQLAQYQIHVQLSATPVDISRDVIVTCRNYVYNGS